LAERWFSQSEFRVSRELWKSWCFTRYAVGHEPATGAALPDARIRAAGPSSGGGRWLAQKKAQGTPGYLDVAVSSAVRVCLAARQHGLDIAGRCSVSAANPSPRRGLGSSRRRLPALCHYHLAEVGRLGVAVYRASGRDEVHVVTDSIALLQREAVRGGATVGALFCSTLHPAVPKLMVNVELGDCGVLSERTCGCPFDRLGFRQTSAHHPELREADD